MRRRLSFDDYSGAITNLRRYPEFSGGLVDLLQPIPKFRNVLVHQYAELDFERIVAALRNLEPLAEFARIAAKLLLEAD